MRVVLDTNILVSAIIAPTGNPAAIYTVPKRDLHRAP
jgi:predicted nucleic acid-binding protein